MFVQTKPSQLKEEIQNAFLRHVDTIGTTVNSLTHTDTISVTAKSESVTG